MNTSAEKTSPEAWIKARKELLAGAGNANLAAHLVRMLFQTHGVLRTEEVKAGVGEQGGESQLEAAGVGIVRELARRQIHRGREIRRPGRDEHPSMMPRKSVDPEWWRWRKVFGSPWTDNSEHINILELRAFLAGLQWRLRSEKNIHSKALHLVDSWVILGALAKGRSPSQRLGPLITKVSSLLLAASFTLMLAYVRTDRNPADAPSRAKL